MADAQKVIARMELDKLHRGLVVELDRRLVKPPESEGVAAVPAPAPVELVEVSQAIEVVQETMATLRGLKDRSEEQGSTIQRLEGERASLSVDLRQTEAQLDEASKRIAVMQDEAAQARRNIERLESERAELVSSNEKLKSDLLLLVESVMTSFAKQKEAVAEIQAQEAS